MMFLFWLMLCLIPFTVVAVNMVTWHRPKGTLLSQQCPSPSVSVLIPARNEENNIKECIEQIYESTQQPLEVIVYNDNSTDNTSSILQSLQIKHPTLRVIQGSPLPKGWTGKNHACHQLSKEARGNFFLFLDADTRLFPQGISALLEVANTPKLPSDFVSALPKQTSVSFAEKMLMPFLQLAFIAWLPLELVRRAPFASMTAAIGQLVLIRQQTYHQIGGFESIKMELVDDMALAKRCKSLGYHVRFIDGWHIGSCRMYRSLTEIWAGFSKNVFIGLGRSIPLWTSVTILHVVCFVLPFVVAPWHDLYEGPESIWVWCCVAMNMGIRILMALRFQPSMVSVLCHPLASCLVIALFINSGIQTLFGQVRWKGRDYSDVHA